MTTCYLAPDPIQSTQFIPGGNTPANGGQLFFYVAGSSTKQTVYKDNAAAVSWTNPIVLDSGGNLPSGGEVWFPTGQTFKVIFAPSNDTDPPASPYWTKDNLAGMNDVQVTAQSEWVSGPTPTFISATQFTLVGDQTSTFTNGRRLKSSNTGGTAYSTITSVSFGGVTTVVNVVNDSIGLDSGLSAVFYGILDPANPSIMAAEVNRKGATVNAPLNGTTNIWSTPGDYTHVASTGPVRFFSTAPYPGAQKHLIFDQAMTIFSSAAMVINGNSNVTTAANDRAVVRADTVSTYVLDFTPQSGLPAVPIPLTALTSFAFSSMTNYVTSDVAIGTAAYSTGPQIAQGTTGIWLVMGTVTLFDTAATNFQAKLMDGTSTYASSTLNVAANGAASPIALSAIVVNPLGNLRIQAKDSVNNSGLIRSNFSGGTVSTDSFITAVRIG